MPAPYGNSSAEKWTIERTKEILFQVEHWSGKPEFIFLGQALNAVGVRTRMWSYWRAKWADQHEIIRHMELLEERFVSKMIEGAITKRYHAGFVMFCLRNNYHFEDLLQPPTVELPRTEVRIISTAVPPSLQTGVDHEAMAFHQFREDQLYLL